jgi:ATPase subunit of ABC transporter with duplicated ATPase domains
MLQAHGLSYIADPRVGPLFEGLSLSILPGEKVALMGPNGAGKSTLLRILTGEIAPESGVISTRKKTSIAYLPQDFAPHAEGTLGEWTGEGAGVLKRLARFHLSDQMDQPFQTLSFGEKMRASLARLLADDPDFLLLDEPTNHLDLEARLWLEEFLIRCRQGVLFVCHDRAMVNAVVSRVLELDRGKLAEFGGGYDAMRERKRMDFERDKSTYEREKQESRRLKNAAEKTLQRAIGVASKPTQRTFDSKMSPFYKARAKAVDKRAKAIKTRVSHLEDRAIDKPFEAKQVAIEFAARPLRASYPLTVRKLAKAFDRDLFSDLSFQLERGTRTALVGPNGCGKTTLMRILLGEEAADSGDVDWSSDVVVGYLSQSRFTLDPSLHILEALDPKNPKEEQFARSLLGRLHLRGDSVLKPIGVLSVGERTKVELVKLLMTPANVLFLDEPTNHLDIDSLEALEEALMEFPGCILFTSHDRAFVDRVADEVIVMGEISR